MNLRPYRRVLSVRDVRRAVLLGIAVRIPVFAGGVLLTLHVVSGLGLGYSQAGLVTMAYTLGFALSGPWRGRLLDRKGLRRTVLPSLAVLTLCWSVAPFVGYVELLVLASVAGLFSVPVFSIIRQAVMVAASEQDRRTALSLDSVAVEVSFMIGAARRGVGGNDVSHGLVGLPVGRDINRGAHRYRYRAGRGPAGARADVLLGANPVAVGLGSAVGGLVYGGMERPLPATATRQSDRMEHFSPVAQLWGHR